MDVIHPVIYIPSNYTVEVLFQLEKHFHIIYEYGCSLEPSQQKLLGMRKK